MPLTTTPFGSRPSTSLGGSAVRALLCAVAVLGIGAALLARLSVRSMMTVPPPGDVIRITVSVPVRKPLPPLPPLPDFRMSPPLWIPPAPALSAQPPEMTEYVPPPLPDTPSTDPIAVTDFPELPEEPPIPRRRHIAHPAPHPAASLSAPPSASLRIPAESPAPTFTPPSYRSAPPPPYPAALRQRGIEGTVRLRVSLDAAGIPLSVTILQSSGHSDFDSVAEDWVLHYWHFSPARKNGVPVPASVITSVRFTIKN